MNGCAPNSDRRVAFALLAAGRGVRFGAGKLGADLCGRPLWRWAADSAMSAGFDMLHVVTNDPAIAGDCGALGWSVHPNPAAGSGIASSIRIAAMAAAQADVLIVALADMPFIEPGHLRALAGAGGVAFTRQPDGGWGVPAVFPRAAGERLAALEGDRGAASLDWPGAEAIDAPSPRALFDVDTPDELRRARELALGRT